ncbi:hypothetical protein D9M72_605430 [compost metagenome]
MGTAQIGRVDRAEVFAHRGFQCPGIDQPGDAIEQVVLFDHVRGFKQRAGVHELPVQ